MSWDEWPEFFSDPFVPITHPLWRQVRMERSPMEAVCAGGRRRVGVRINFFEKQPKSLGNT